MTSIRKIFKKKFPKRKPISHKGDYGKVALVAGSTGLTGAAALAAMGALRAGAGLVTVVVPESLNGIMEVKLTEAMTYPVPDHGAGFFRGIKGRRLRDLLGFICTRDAVGIGPGFSMHDDALCAARAIVEGLSIPMVLDADALIAFKGKLPFLSKCGKKDSKILTPHLGEFDKLLGTKTMVALASRKKAALMAAKKLQGVVVLKGSKTVVASEEGKVYINDTGNPGMASGGTGDVLTGILTSFLGFGHDSFTAACMGVYLHGLAGDLAAAQVGKNSLIASDLIAAIPAAFQNILGRSNA